MQQKKTITLQDWQQRLDRVSIDKGQLNELVLNYLEHEGFQEAAVNFATECTSLSSTTNNTNTNTQILPPQSITCMQTRKSIKDSISQGCIDDAICKINTVDPAILNQNAQLFFSLLQQKLVELIRAGKVDEALQFAQAEIVPQAEQNPAFLPALEQTMALLAFDLKASEQVLHVLHPSQRQAVAAAVNEAVLEAQGREKESKLGAMLKQLSWAQQRLAEKIVFPSVGNFADPELFLQGKSD